MTPHHLPLLSLLLSTIIVLSGCTISPSTPSQDKEHALTQEQRTQQLINNNQWQLKGKIAFIQKIINKKDKRESASMTWRVNEEDQTQELNLTSYLGINVLQLESKQNHHLINVDGKTYHGTDLPRLIYSLTGLTLPTNALKFWLKGLLYNPEDKLVINKKTQFPERISSYYHNALWQINYDNYKRFNGIDMPTKITLKKENLTIKVAINNWNFND